MKHITIPAITLLALFSLVACSTARAQASAKEAATVPPVASPIPVITSIQTAASNAVDEAEVRDLVESFGAKLKLISLLAPTAAEDLQKQYSEFVSPALLESWMNDVSKAPGRMVSSPWPDRIEITTLSKEDSHKYEVTGFVIEITST